MRTIVVNSEEDIPEEYPTEYIMDSLDSICRYHGRQLGAVHVSESETITAGYLTNHSERSAYFEILYNVQTLDETFDLLNSIEHNNIWLNQIDEDVTVLDGTLLLRGKLKPVEAHNTLYIDIDGKIIVVNLHSIDRTIPDELKGRIEVVPWCHGNDIWIRYTVGELLLERADERTIPSDTISINGTDYTQSEFELLLDDCMKTTYNKYDLNTIQEEVLSFNILPKLRPNNQSETIAYVGE